MYRYLLHKKASHQKANIMKHDRIAGSRKTANLSRAAVTGKVLNHYDVISTSAQHLKGAILRFHNL